MFSDNPQNCTKALLYFSKQIWSSQNTKPVHPCTTWEEISVNTFGLSPNQMKTLDDAIDSLVSVYPFKFAKIEIKSQVEVDDVWIPRGTDVILVFVLFGLLLLLASISLEQKKSSILLQKKKF